MRPEDSATDWHLSESQLEEAARRAAAASQPVAASASPPRAATPQAAAPQPAPAEAAPDDLLVGSTLRGYHIERKLGQGGMGAVYLAVHEQLQRQVAIKVLPPAMAHDAQLISRFRREARALAKLDSPHIVPVHDMFEEGGRFFIAMGLAAGGSVKDLLKAGPLDEARARRILLETALGLASAHSQGIVHRDIKPDNLLLDEQGRVKIADFGLAKGGLGAQGLTVVGSVMGTPAYMSPEQWDDSSSADIRSDLYSLGCTFFKMLSGRVPFSGAGLTAYMKAHCSAPIPDVRSLRPDVSDASVALLERLLAKDAAARIQTPAELVEALEATARGATLVEGTAPPPVPLAGPSARTAWPSMEGSSTPGTKPDAAEEGSKPGAGSAAVEPSAPVEPSTPDASPSLPAGSLASPQPSPPASVAPEAPPAAELTLQGQAAPLSPRAARPWWLLAVALVLLAVGVWWLRGGPRGGNDGPGAGGEQPVQPPPTGTELWWTPTARQQAAAARLGVPLAISEQGSEFVLIPAGSFEMGSPLDAVGRLADELPHRVELSGDLFMLAHEVSRGMWERVTGNALPAEPQRGANHPAVKIDWYQAVDFCNRLSALQGLQPAYQVVGQQVSLLAGADGYRLPSEAEWEYACRAETETPFWSGKRLSAREANFSAVEEFLFSEGSLMQLAEVGTLQANPWGLFDMHGNAYEWCGDFYGAYPDASLRDPQGPATGINRIIRGGSCYRDASYCRSARRAHLKPDTRGESVGFRVVRPVR